VYQNNKRAKRIRRKNGVAEIEKSQKTEGVFDVEENGCVPENSANISPCLSSKNDEVPCKNRVMVIGKQVEDTEEFSEPWRLVTKPRKQRVGQSDDVVSCAKGLIQKYNVFKILVLSYFNWQFFFFWFSVQQCVNESTRIRSYHTGKSSSIQYRSGSETERTKRDTYSLSDPTHVLSPNSVSAFGSHKDDSGSTAKRTRVQTDVEDFECQYSSDLEFENNQNDELKEVGGMILKIHSNSYKIKAPTQYSCPSCNISLRTKIMFHNVIVNKEFAS